MEKTFKTLDEQIEILKNKGLKITNLEEAKYILSKMNYYQLINGYQTPFLEKNSKNKYFIKNTTINEIYSLYELDRKFKILLMEYLLIFENNLKSTFSYHFSKIYNEPYSYLNINSYSKKNINFALVSISEFSNLLKKNKIPIKHYLEKHNFVPLWVIINYATLGNLSNFFNAMDENIKNDIISDFNNSYNLQYNESINLTIYQLKDLIEISKHYRNISAHNDLLYSSKPPIIKSDFNNLINIPANTIFGLINLLKYVLPKEQYNNLNSAINYQIKKYNQSFNSISSTEIFKNYGIK